MSGDPGTLVQMNGTERPRILSLDLLESYARERDIDVRLERRHELGRWSCTLVARGQGAPVVATGTSAREAIRRALEAAGVDLPDG
jgi:hypothetical protein